jgi:hypothetical protein
MLRCDGTHFYMQILLTFLCRQRARQARLRQKPVPFETTKEIKLGALTRRYDTSTTRFLCILS